jgi:hypothetical protein
VTALQESVHSNETIVRKVPILPAERLCESRLMSRRDPCGWWRELRGRGLGGRVAGGAPHRRLVRQLQAQARQMSEWTSGFVVGVFAMIVVNMILNVLLWMYIQRLDTE